jgi:hypothetical protein
MFTPVVPAKAGTQEFQSLAPCSCQGQALGPRLRGDDEFVRPQVF